MVPKLTFVYDRKGQATKNKTAVVELRITAGKLRKYISTGVQLLPKEWSNGSVVGRSDWKEVNNQLQTIMRKCSEIITGMMDECCLDINAIPSMLKGRMIRQDTFMEYAKGIAANKYNKVSHGTQVHYQQWFRFMEKWKGIIYFSDITEKNIMRLDDELSSRGLKECTRWNYHKILKLFILRAVEDGLIKQNPYKRLDIKRGNEEGIQRYLSPKEFHNFENCIIPIDRLRRVRDLFVFQTYTMMGYADLAAFDYKKCTKLKGQTVYKGKRQKTGQEFITVITEQALSILKRYKYKLPIISNVKYNEYLKAAVMYAQIDKSVSSHWARHTGATMLLNEGHLPIHIIQHILGHASIRETERTYAKLMDETIVDTMVSYQKKIR